MKNEISSISCKLLAEEDLVYRVFKNVRSFLPPEHPEQHRHDIQQALTGLAG